MTVSEPAWVDVGGFRPNPGQFPIAVERHLNNFVGDHLPGVTTVTNAARYYALHGLIAEEAQKSGLDESQTIDLLRRTEVLLAYVCRVHASSSSHDPRTPAAHGADFVARVSASGSVDVAAAARIGRETYTVAKWGFAQPYRGSELTLKILSQRAFTPGEWYDAEAARSVLGPVLESARNATEFSEADARQLEAACLCSTPRCRDGAWLAGLLAGDQDFDQKHLTRGGLLGQIGRMVSVVVTSADVKNAIDLGDYVMFSPDLLEHGRLRGMVGPRRWRGALLRAESVYAWRRIWLHVNQLVGGATPVDTLIDTFADLMPDATVDDFRRSLPATRNDKGQPQPAERELSALPDLHAWLARTFLGARRLGELDTEELKGFRAPDEARGNLSQELSPGWLAAQLDASAHQPLRDFGRELALTLIQRSQRVALRKSRFDAKEMVFHFPARLHVRDGLAVQIFRETAPQPATRLPQYLSIARQTGLLVYDDEGRLRLGPNGDRIA